MKYLKTYENFKPIKNNLEKPFKIKKNIDKSIRYLQKGIKSLRKRLDNDDNINNPAKIQKDKRSKMNKDKNDKIQQLKDLTFKQIKQNTYIRNNPVNENIKNSKNLIEVLESEDFKPEDILNYMGIKNFKVEQSYNYQTHKYEPDYDINNISFYMRTGDLEDIMNLERGTINYIFAWESPYSNQEYYIDDDELNYLINYLSDEVIKNIEKLAEIFDYNIDSNKEGELYDFFNYLGLKNELRDFKYEIQSANEIAIRNVARDIIKKLPFKLDQKNSEGYDLLISINYDTIIKYMKEYNIQVETIKDFLKNVDSEFSYDIEYDELKNEYLDYNDLIREVDNVVDKYLNSPDDIFIKLIEIDNLELFKKKVDLANFEWMYDVNINYNRVRCNLFQLAKEYNKKILDWLNSEEFEKIIENRSQEELDAYSEFKYKEDIESFNL